MKKDIFIKQYKSRMIAFSITVPLLCLFFIILGVILWISLADLDGWKYGISFFAIALVIGIIGGFGLKHMKNNIKKHENESKKN